MNGIKERILSYFGDGVQLVAEKSSDGILLSSDGKEVKAPNTVNKYERLAKEILDKKKDYNACILVNDEAYLGEIVRLGKNIPTVLDDLCQIVGAGVSVSYTFDTASVLRKLFFKNAVILKGVGVLCFGRTLDEAHTCALVVNKGAKAYIEGTVLGKIKPIPVVEAMLMHLIYLKKYSASDQKAKMEKEGA